MIRLIESFKQMLKVARRNLGSIADAYRVAACIAVGGKPYSDVAVIGTVLDRIVDKGDEHLLDSVAVGICCTAFLGDVRNDMLAPR